MRTSREVERLAVHASPGMFALWAGDGAWKMAPHLQLLDHDDGPDALEMAVRLAEGLLAVPANDPGFTVERVSTG